MGCGDCHCRKWELRLNRAWRRMWAYATRRLRPAATTPSDEESDKAEKVRPGIRRTLTMGPNGRSHMRLCLHVGWDASSSPAQLLYYG